MRLKRIQLLHLVFLTHILFLLMSTSFFTFLRVSGLQNDGYELISSSGTVDYPPPLEPPPTGVWRPWSANSYWNTKIPENPKIHPNSAQMIDWFLSVPEHYGGTFQINIHGWSDTIWECDEDTPRYTVYRPSGAVAFTNVPIPDNFAHDPQADAGAVIIDHYEEWMYTTAGMKYTGGKWVATIAIARWPLYGSGVTDNYEWIAGGASIPSYCAMIRPEEIEAGVIPRAICCSLHFPKAGWKVYPPASSTDGKSYDQWAIPEGARLQLDPDFDIDSLNVNRAAKIILKCFQEYGVVVKECGGRSCIYAENPLGIIAAGGTDPWPDLGVDSSILKGTELRNLPWRVIDYSVFGAVEEEF